MATYFDVFLFTILGSVISLIGGILLMSHKKTARNLAKYATPFAAGGLLAAVFFDLLPEALDEASATKVMISCVVGLLGFFYLERFLRWFHHHHDDHEDRGAVSRPLIIAGNTLHNALDGVAIAAAFLVSVPIGIVTTLAVAAHEIPREIGDFGLLLSRGMSRSGVVTVHIVSSLATTVVALITFGLGGSQNIPIGVLLGLSSGFMLYIAASDIIPSIHHDVKDNELFDIRPLLVLVGVIVVGAGIAFAKQFGG
ncbi:MAG: ZIP family metal transporter [Candidatus Saccharimonadales bacterium]